MQGVTDTTLAVADNILSTTHDVVDKYYPATKDDQSNIGWFIFDF